MWDGKPPAYPDSLSYSQLLRLGHSLTELVCHLWARQATEEQSQQESTRPGQDTVPPPPKLSPYPHTSGAGQQPHSPDVSRQQVLKEGQLVMLSQGTSFSTAWGFGRRRRARACIIQGTCWAPCSQVPFAVSHLKPAGQQCTWSSQHTA